MLAGDVRLILAVREGEDVPDPISALWRQNLVERQDLAELGPEQLGSLIEAGIGDLNVLTRDALARHSGGNVLFALELVRAARASGDLQRVDGLWNWNGEIPLAPRLSDVVGDRVHRLTPGAQRALGCVALAEPLSAAVARRIIDAEALAELEAQGLVGVPPDGAGQLRLAHPLYGDVVLSALGSVVRAELLQILITALRGQSGVEAAQLAGWQLELGVADDARMLCEGARKCNDRFDHERAAALAAASRDAGGGAEAAVELARALVRRGRFIEADRILQEAENDVLDSGDPQLARRYLAECFAARYMGLGDADGMLATVALHDRSPGMQAVASAGYRTQIALDDGDFERVIVEASPVLADPDDPWTHLLCLESTAEGLAWQGRFEESRDLHRRMDVLADSGDPLVIRAAASARFQESLCADLEGDPRRILTALDTDDPRVWGRDPQMDALGRLIGGIGLMRCGRLDEAQRELRECLAGYRRGDTGGAAGWAMAMLAQVEAMRGDRAAAHDALEQSKGLRLRRPSARMVADLALAEAWTRALDGDLSGAVRVLESTAESVDERQTGLLVVPLLHQAGCWGGAVRRVADRLARIADRTGAEMPRLCADHLVAVADRDAGAQAAAAERFASAGQLLRAVEAALLAADAFRAAGRGRDAQRMSSRGETWRSRCEMAWTPLLRGRGDDPSAVWASAGLSRREQEAARLAAEGHSNTEIASLLVLSVRTVESHLYRAFGKLGIRQREELIGLFEGAQVEMQ